MYPLLSFLLHKANFILIFINLPEGIPEKHYKDVKITSSQIASLERLMYLFMKRIIKLCYEILGQSNNEPSSFAKFKSG